jgi:hypothetical protein
MTAPDTRRKRMIIEMDDNGWNPTIVRVGEFYVEADARQQADRDALLTMVADLDRCEHGRHEGDVCGSCGGPSHGNPFLESGSPLGYDIAGRPYIITASRSKMHAEDWRP